MKFIVGTTLTREPEVNLGFEAATEELQRELGDIAYVFALFNGKKYPLVWLRKVDGKLMVIRNGNVSEAFAEFCILDSDSRIEDLFPEVTR